MIPFSVSKQAHILAVLEGQMSKSKSAVMCFRALSFPADLGVICERMAGDEEA